MFRILKSFLLLIALCGAVLGGSWLYLDRYLDEPLNIPGNEFVFQLEPGTSFSAMTRQLDEAGVLPSPLTLNVYARLDSSAARIKAGEYALAVGTTVRGMLQIFQQGRVRQYEVTLPEGLTFRQALAHLRAQPALLSRVSDDVPLWRQLQLSPELAEHPEGQFFPDTYRYRRGDSDLDILKRAYQRMLDILVDEWKEREEGLPYDSPYQALIMASVVEKETGVPSERQRIAGVFVRRLQRGMRLQTDPTVIYGLGEDFDNNLRSRHLKDAGNPYNTYRHSGLPPTPIALPGREAIHASLHPDKGDALYFVAKGDGSHYFSSTLAEHQQAVRNYQLKNRRSDYRSAPALERAQ